MKNSFETLLWHLLSSLLQRLHEGLLLHEPAVASQEAKDPAHGAHLSRLDSTGRLKTSSPSKWAATSSASKMLSSRLN